jgi:hypothetical protein
MYRITVEECGNNKEHVMCFRSQGSGVFSENRSSKQVNKKCHWVI